MTTGTDPEWLVAWRAKRAAALTAVIPMTDPTFGIQRSTATGLIQTLQPGWVYVLVSGTGVERRRMLTAFARRGRARTVLYSTALAEAHTAKSSPDEYQTGGMAWSIVRAHVGRFLREDRPVVVDVPFVPGALARFTEYCFTAGALAVVAVCLTTEYEETWEDDGFTGVYWITVQA